MEPNKEGKYKVEDSLRLPDHVLDRVASQYSDFYTFRNARSGSFKQFQGYSFEDMLKTSRELFWNTTKTGSADLEALGLDFNFPFVRKEVLDFLGRLSSLNIVPKIEGEELSMHGVRVLQAMYKKWRVKSNDRVEKFWETLYGIVNGTVCLAVTFDGKESEKRFLNSYNPETGEYKIDTKKMRGWNDVKTEIVPIEEMYFKKLWNRNVQAQGKTIRKQEMTESEFKAQFGKHPFAPYVQPGNRIAEDSLFFQLLDGSGITTTDKIQVFTEFDTDTDEKLLTANGIPLNMVGKGKDMKVMPNPFHHKMQPYVVSPHSPIDEKFIYGLPMPFNIRASSKLLNTSYTMLVEQELRAIDTPYLTSDIEAPEIIFGEKKVIPVMDVNAYKPVDVKEASTPFYTMMNSLQGILTSHAQGGNQQIVPSRQPKAAREVIAMENMKQQAVANSLILYFDMVRQELLLMLKTAVQFYDSSKYAEFEGNIIRSITIPDFPMRNGGMGRLELRIVKEPQKALALYFESARKSAENGKRTEIIEYPVESLGKLIDMSISDIKLEPEQATELERAAWNQDVLKPLVEVFMPMGLADPAKVFLRWAEKNGEHISDFASDQSLPDLMATWGKKYKLPPNYQEAVSRRNTSAQQGNMLQSTTGTMFGSQSNGGYGGELEMPENIT